MKFCVKKIYRYTSYKDGIDTKNNREKINQNLRNNFETLKKNKKNCENLGSLQYLVIFPNENQHRFHYQGEAATVIQPVDSRVTDFIRKQIREGCACQKIFTQGQGILSRKQFLMGRRLKKVKDARLFHRGKK